MHTRGRATLLLLAHVIVLTATSRSDGPEPWQASDDFTVAAPAFNEESHVIGFHVVVTDPDLADDAPDRSFVTEVKAVARGDFAALDGELVLYALPDGADAFDPATASEVERVSLGAADTDNAVTVYAYAEAAFDDGSTEFTSAYAVQYTGNLGFDGDVWLSAEAGGSYDGTGDETIRIELL